MRRTFIAGSLITALWCGSLPVSHGQSFPEAGWHLAIGAGPNYTAQRDEVTSLLTYSGTGTAMGMQLSREGRWQVVLDVTYYRARRTPIGAVREETTPRSDQVDGGGVALSVRRLVMRRAALRLHAGLQFYGRGAQWNTEIAPGSSTRESHGDAFGAVALDTRFEYAISPRHRLAVHLAVPLAGLAYRPAYTDFYTSVAAVTWPRLAGIDAEGGYCLALSSRLALRAGYRLQVLRYMDAPEVRRLAHRFLAGFTVRLSR